MSKSAKRSKIAVICLLAFLVSMFSLPCLAVDTSTPAFRFSHLVDNEKNDNLIFTYYDSDFENIDISITKDNEKIFNTSLNEGTSSVDIRGLGIGEEYEYEVIIDGKNSYSGILKLTSESVEYTDASNTPMPISDGQVFQAKTSSGSNIGTSTYSLFRAIESARSAGSGAYVLMNSSTEVFRMNGSAVYHKYQFDQYYGSTTSLSAAQAWIRDYNYSHIINGSGQMLYSYLKSMNGNVDAIDANNAYSLERNHGAYYYNGSWSGTSYKKISFDVDLSNASCVRANSSSNMPANGYAFACITQSTGVAEFGIILGGTGTSTAVKPYYKLPGSSTVNTQNTSLATGSRNSSTGEITWGNDDVIRITLGLMSGKMYCKAENLSTGTVYENTITASPLSTTAATTFSTFVSLVPDPSGYGVYEDVLRDIRSGASFRGVKIKNATLYTTTSATSGSSMAPNTSNSGRAYIYNTDCSSYSSTGSGMSTVETISIFYDRGLN